MKVRTLLRTFFMKKLFTLILFVTHCFGLTAQIFDALGKTMRTNEPGFFVKLDTRNAFVSNSKIAVTGVLVGMAYGKNKELKLTTGYSWLPNKFGIRFFEGNAKLSMRYLTTGIEYEFYNKGKVSASIPIQVGFGGVQKRTYLDNELFRLERKPIMSYEAMMIGNYRLLKYFGVGMGIGYRVFLIHNKAFGETFNSPIYTIKLNVYFQELYQLIKK